MLPDRFKEKIDRDLSKILSAGIIDLHSIILFGSCANGKLKATSDIDLLIISQEKVPRSIRSDLYSECQEPIRGVSTDLVFYTFDEYQNSTSLFINSIKKEGVCIWTNQEIPIMA